MNRRVELVRNRLEQALTPTRLELFDESAAHLGHAGAQSGGGHFHAVIVAAVFEGKSLIQRHQMVYRALGDLMQSEIHAFSMKVFSPSEFQTKEHSQ